MKKNVFIESNTKVNVNEVVESLGLKAWKNRRNAKDVRYYINEKDLEKLDLKNDVYKIGENGGIEFVGKRVNTFHSQFTGRYYSGVYNKTYVDPEGSVHTNWLPFGEGNADFAEDVAVALSK